MSDPMSKTQHTVWWPGGSCPACDGLLATTGRRAWCTQTGCDWTDSHDHDPILKDSSMPLTSNQRAYAAAYQTSLVEDKNEPGLDAFDITEGQAEMVQSRVEKGTVDYEELPPMLRPPELDTDE